MNSLLLEMKTREHGKTNASVAQALNIDQVTYYRKRKGLTEFTRKEIQGIRKELDLSDKEVDQIFFDD